MIEEFFGWWLRQMSRLFAGWLTRPLMRPDALIVAIDRLGDGVAAEAEGALLVRRGGLETFAAALHRDSPAPAAAMPDLGTGLRLPPSMVLQREVVLPLAAARDLQTVLSFEMDRLTPFAAAEVIWGTGGLQRDAERGQLRLTLILTLRQPVEQLLAALARRGLRPSFLETNAGTISLGGWRRRPRRPRRLALYGLCGVLAASCLIVPPLRQHFALRTAAAQIAALAPALHEAVQLRQRLVIAAAGQQAVAAAEQNGDALKILAALTRTLPDDTWLSDLSLKSGELTIDGQSANAAALIATLAGAPGFRDPGFAAPVTRAMDGSADLFSIHATAAP